MAPEPDKRLIDRFRTATLRLTLAEPEALALAVSGGPDSLAMLLLARAAFPGRIHAATVDHGLRVAAADEVRAVADLCARLCVPHAALRIPDAAAARLRSCGNLQAEARRWRLALLHRWCRRHALHWLATAHHADDQAETLLMRLSRGAGLAGLSAIRPHLVHQHTEGERALAVDSGTVAVIRPLLGFTKAELEGVCETAGLTPANDPSNDDPRFDRTRARRLLAAEPWLDANRLAASAHHLGEAEAALAWATQQEMERRLKSIPGEARFVYDLSDLPPEIVRRIAADAIGRIDATVMSGDRTPPRGPELHRLIEAVAASGNATLGHTLVSRRGDVWTFTPAPPRRSH